MAARQVSYACDEIIYTEGTKNKRMYIILEGQVALYHDYGGPTEYIIGACGKGKIFGEMNMFTDEPAQYTAVAFTDVKLAWFEKENFSSFVKEYPDNVFVLLEKIAKSYNLMCKNLEMSITEIGELQYQLDKANQGLQKAEEKEKIKMSRSVLEAKVNRTGTYHYAGRNLS